MKRGRRATRPIGWIDYTDEQKIEFLEKIKKPTASEKKELRYLTQKKKFAGFKEWLDKKRAEEKQTTEYQVKLKERQERKCREKREVNSCSECLRYANCHEGKPLFKENSTGVGEMRLGQALILSIEDDIRRCYKHGWKDQMNFWVKVLASERTNLLTAETIDGYASAQALLRECYKMYGDFEPRYEQCQAKYKPVLEKLEKELQGAKGNSARAEKIADEINRVLTKLYGNTMRSYK